MFATKMMPQPSCSDMLRKFAEPLIDGDDEASLDKALGLAMLFWTLAQISEPLEREAAIANLADAQTSGSELERRRFRRLAQFMVARHDSMFGAV